MKLRVIKVCERCDAGRYVIEAEGSGRVVLRDICGDVMGSMWAYNVMRVLVVLGEMSVDEAAVELVRANDEFDGAHPCSCF